MSTPLEYPIHYQDSKSFSRARTSLARPIKLKTHLLFLALSAGLLLFGSRHAAAATLTVTNTSDSGAGSLRQAILDAVSGDTINFSLPANSMITLTSAELSINKSLIITGPGADTLTVQRSAAGGTSDFRIFDITGMSDVTISGLTIANGRSGAGDGGGILNAGSGTVTVTDSTISGNVTTSGNGAGLSNSGTMRVTNTTFSGNSSTGGGNGGGIDNEGTLDVSNSHVTGNSTTNGNGGGIFNFGTVTFTHCVFSANTTTTGGNGGGLYNDGTATLTDSNVSNNTSAGGGNGGGIYNIGTTNVTNSTLSRNSSMDGGNGGGIYNDGTTNVTNSTLSGNSSIDGGNGGGIDNDDGTVKITNCTVSNNSTAGGGNGGGVAAISGTTSIKNTIVALNTGDGSGPDVSGHFTSLGFNLIGRSDGSTGFSNGMNGDRTGTTAAPLDALLGSLQNNGGPTFTQALLFGSPAIDQGAAATDPATGDPITTDQRGMSRPVDRPKIANASGGNGSDIGSFEVQTPSLLLNISTRLNVLTGDNVLIGGFIITGTEKKKVIVRGIGPSLSHAMPPVPDVLADPVLELHNATTTLATNDNWRDTQEAEIIATGIPPTDDLESAIVATLDPGPYTAILRGKNGGTGVGLVEVYDLDQTSASQLANISTRGFVDTGNNVMIAGFIVGDGGGATVLVRAIGPSLSARGVSGVLADPTLDLHDANGTVIASNDNWRSDQEAAIMATTIPPANDSESAIEDTLVPGNYTAIVRGVNNTTGVALVEVFNLN
jgi:hypothetical protein